MHSYSFYYNKYKKNILVRNILHFFSGNLIVIFISSVVQFIIPKIVSVNDFGVFKTFTLYLGYTSLLHFGLKDGIYLRLCEENSNINRVENDQYFTALTYQQLIIFIFLCIISFFFKGFNIFFLLTLAVASVVFILITFFESFYQARKDFKIVVFLRMIKEGTFLIFIGLLILFGIQINLNSLIILLLISFVITYVIYVFISRKDLRLISISNLDKLIIRPVYRRGLHQMIGNLGHQFNANIDKLFITIFYSSTTFAIYSFGGMFFILSNVLLTSVSTVLLPYLFDPTQNLANQYLRISKYLNLTVFFVLPYLILVFVLTKYYYPEYLDSINIIAYFSFSMVYNGIISISQNNFLKVLKLDKKYIQINYLALSITIVVMFILWYLKVDTYYFAMLVSVVMFLRYLGNEIIILKEFKLSVSRIILPNTLIIGVGILSIIIAKLFV